MNREGEGEGEDDIRVSSRFGVILTTCAMPYLGNQRLMILQVDGN